MVYESVEPQFEAPYVFFRKVAAARSARVAATTTERRWSASFRSLVAELLALPELLETVNDRLTVMETARERQSVKPHTPPQDLFENRRIFLPTYPDAPVMSAKATNTPPATALYVTGSGTFLAMAPYRARTDLFSSTVH